jgi:DNA-binding Xre family transcriptional regulator
MPQFIDAGKAVREAQIIKRFSSSELARQCATSPSQVIRWRTQVNMKVHTMQRICEALDIDVETFINLGMD